MTIQMKVKYDKYFIYRNWILELDLPDRSATETFSSSSPDP